MRLIYRDYRSFGHTRLTAFTLSVPGWLFYGCAIAIGCAIGGLYAG